MKKTSILGLFLVLSVAVISGCSNSGTQTGTTGSGSNNLEAFATCVTEKGAVFYGTTRCSHCNNQKALFGDAMKNIKFVDCDKEVQACTAAGIQSYPTRVFSDGTKASGTQGLDQLAAKTACTL